MIIFMIQRLRAKTKKEKGEIRLWGLITHVAIAFFFEYILLCSRMNYLLEMGPNAYKPTIGKNDLVWLGPQYFTVGSHTLARNHCPTDLGGYDNQGTPAAADFCAFWFLPFSAGIMNSSYEAFSTCLALIIYILLQYIAVGLKLAAEKVELGNEVPENETFLARIGRIVLTRMNNMYRRSPGETALSEVSPEANRHESCISKVYRISRTAIVGAIMKTPVLVYCLILSCQQALCLLPLTSLEANPFCAYLQVPLSQQESICLYKWAAGAIPCGLPLLLASALSFLFGLGCVNFCGESNGSNEDKSAGRVFILIGICIALASLVIGGVGACLLIIWLFAGVPLGIWFRIAGIQSSILQQGHLMIEGVAVLVPYISFFILDVIESFFCVAAVDE